MSLKSLQRVLDIQRTVDRMIEDQERRRQIVARSRISDTLEQAHFIEGVIQSITESTTTFRHHIAGHKRLANDMAATIEQLAARSSSEALVIPALSSGPHAIFAKLAEELAQNQSRLDATGVKLAIHPALDGPLGDVVDNQFANRLSLIASASASSQISAAIRNQASFARVGAAVAAAGFALSDENIRSRGNIRAVDNFFGDWARLAELPDHYGRDERVRRETLQEVRADDSLLDVSTEEAAALFSQSSFSSDGTPIVLLGEPIGLVITRDPDDIACRLLRRTERALRALISTILQKNYGSDWPADLMPDRAASWSQKQETDKQNNLPPADLIEYAEFGELPDILQKHWSGNFSGRGATAKKVTSRIRALVPHRNYGFHSRPVTPEQLLTIAYSVRALESFLVAENTEDDDQ